MRTIHGKILFIDMENDKQTVTLSSEGETKVFTLQEAYLIDSGTNSRLQLEDMQNREVRLYTKEEAVAAIVTATEQNIAHYAEVELVEEDAEGNLRVTTDEGSRIVTIAREAEITPWLTRNIVRLQDIQVGSKVLLYYDLLTMSLPAQAYTEKVILLAPAF